MLLEKYNINESRARAAEVNPLIVTDDHARKALFEKLHRSGGQGAVGKSGRGRKRITRRGVMVRGNSFAGQRFGQRVVVKIRYVKHGKKAAGKGGGSAPRVAALCAHVRYISRPGAGKDEEQAVLFDAWNESVGRKDFVTLCQDDRHHFRFIISPENGHNIKDFQLYVRDVMGLVEKDLGTKLEWISAVHFDTEDPHAHVIVRGKTDKGQDLVIGQDYIKEGVRKRAQEVATTLLGERSLQDVQKSLEKEVRAMRVTSLDRFIEQQAQAKADAERAIDVRLPQNFGKSLFYEGLIKGRLKFLGTAGLAQENSPGIFTVKEDYQDALNQIATRNDVVKQLYNRVDPSIANRLADLSIYSIKEGEGPVVEGRVAAKGFQDEISDRKFVMVKEAAGQLHYVPVGEFRRYDDLEEGSLVRVRPGEAGTGKADYNLLAMAQMNGGLYDPEQHLAHVTTQMKYVPESDRDKYIEAHSVRLATLEKNGIVRAVGEGRYEIPGDVIERGAEITRDMAAREKKRFYPVMDILSATPPEKLADQPKKTWLDKELYKQSIGKPPSVVYDEGIKSALEQRKKWLVGHDLAIIQSNGEFAMRDYALPRLDKLEVYTAGRALARQLDIEFNDSEVRVNTAMRYEGHVTLETGPWAVVRRGNMLQLAPSRETPGIDPGTQVIFQQKGDKTFEMRSLNKEQEASKSKGKEQEREL